MPKHIQEGHLNSNAFHKDMTEDGIRPKTLSSENGLTKVSVTETNTVEFQVNNTSAGKIESDGKWDINLKNDSDFTKVNEANTFTESQNILKDSAFVKTNESANGYTQSTIGHNTSGGLMSLRTPDNAKKVQLSSYGDNYILGNLGIGRVPEGGLSENWSHLGIGSSSSIVSPNTIGSSGVTIVNNAYLTDSGYVFIEDGVASSIFINPSGGFTSYSSEQGLAGEIAQAKIVFRVTEDGDTVNNATSYQYWGSEDIDGSIRTYIDGGQIKAQKRTAGVWGDDQTITAFA